jgi:hypothetical protein
MRTVIFLLPFSLVSLLSHYRLYCCVSGISLSTEQWSAFRKSVPAIEEAVSKMELKLR